eukprot:5451822-Pyramimonas_sp.AAC.2
MGLFSLPFCFCDWCLPPSHHPRARRSVRAQACPPNPLGAVRCGALDQLRFMSHLGLMLVTSAGARFFHERYVRPPTFLSPLATTRPPPHLLSGRTEWT